jgi:lysophospholipase L1-like esterase
LEVSVVDYRRIRPIVYVILAAGALVALGGSHTGVAARSASSPLYVALGDSVEVGFGDDIASDGVGYVQPFGALLSSTLGQPVDVQNLGVFGATTREITLRELPAALAAIHSHQDNEVVISWGGGGVDLGQVALSHQAAVCKQTPSCLARFNAALNEAEQAIDRTIAALRLAGGPNARILMRTQYNALLKTGCQAPQAVELGTVTLEGAPGTILDRGLNDRIRTVADHYGAQVIDLFPAFALYADQLVASDCVHPNGLGYQVILNLFASALQ